MWARQTWFTGSRDGSEVRICSIPDSKSTHLAETNGIGLLAEALTAEVKTVLADETSLVGAEAAVGTHYQHSPSISLAPPSIPLLLSIPQVTLFYSLMPDGRHMKTDAHH